MKAALAVIVGALLSATALAAAAGIFREGPLPAMTGGFGESSCRSCHFDNPENDQAGSLRITGIPPQYAPGGKYPITVTVTRRGLTAAGFEMSSRFESGPFVGQQAGHLQAPDSRTQIVFAPGGRVQYIQHTKTGAQAALGRGRWTIYWTAPATATDPIVFHVAANASNDDASPLGDFIYTTAVTSKGR